MAKQQTKKSISEIYEKHKAKITKKKKVAPKRPAKTATKAKTKAVVPDTSVDDACSIPDPAVVQPPVVIDNFESADTTPPAAFTKFKGPSRNDLMLTARNYGIKNFRVLNREELMRVVDVAKHLTVGADPMQNTVIKDVVAGAVARWKAGWKKNKKD